MEKRIRKTGKKQYTVKNPAKYKAVLGAAEKIFAGKGFHEARISDIAKEASVSESTVYEYFSTKEELLFSIPAEEVRDYVEKSREVLKYIHGAADKLRAIITRHLSLYAENEDYAKVVMLILKGNRNFLKTEAYKVVQASARMTIQVLEEGMKNGEFHPDLNPYLVRAMIWGTIEHLVIRRSLLGKPQDLLELTDNITNTILNGITSRKEGSALNIHVTLERKDPDKVKADQK